MKDNHIDELPLSTVLPFRLKGGVFLLYYFCWLPAGFALGCCSTPRSLASEFWWAAPSFLLNFSPVKYNSALCYGQICGNQISVKNGIPL